jgi:hypothetical protein
MSRFARPSKRATPGRVEWQEIRGAIDLAAVATRLLGPATGRRGERGRRLWWHCPFHEDRNPSFCIVPGKRLWRCFGCDAQGDAAALVMKLEGKTFPEALAFLADDTITARRPSAPASSRHEGRPEAPAHPSGMATEAGAALVAGSADRLWSPEGAGALAYLRGRGLSDATIGAARLGWAPRVRAETKGGRPYAASGIVIPWIAGSAPTLIKVRQGDGRRPKYAEVYRDPARHRGLYPGPGAIRPGRPLVVVEGELDALLLGQELGAAAAVVTLGGASARPGVDIFGAMLVATRWFVATDADPAGDQCAAGWPRPARRVRPPGPFKDWTEAYQGGVALRRWWRDVLAGVESPALYTYEELAEWRWGPAEGDPTPGIDAGPRVGARGGAHTR